MELQSRLQNNINGATITVRRLKYSEEKYKTISFFYMLNPCNYYFDESLFPTWPSEVSFQDIEQ